MHFICEVKFWRIYIAIKKTYVDVIVPRGGDNDVVVDLIVQNIHAKLSQHHMCKPYPNLYVIHSTFQVILLTWFYRCNFFNYLSLTFPFVTKFWLISSEFFDLNSHILECKRKRRTIYIVLYFIQIRGMHTFVRDVKTIKLNCLLCRMNNTLGKSLSIKRNFKDITIFLCTSQVVKHDLSRLLFTEK